MTLESPTDMAIYRSQASLAFRLGFIPESSHRELAALTVETSRVLNGLLRSLLQR